MELYEQIKQEMETEKKEKDQEIEKKNIRAMLELIANKEKTITTLQDEVKVLKDKLEKRDYSPVVSLEGRFYTFTWNWRDWNNTTASVFPVIIQ